MNSKNLINSNQDNDAHKKKIKVYKYIPRRETVKTIIKNDSNSYEKKFDELTEVTGTRSVLKILKKLDQVCNAPIQTENKIFKSKFSNDRINSDSSNRKSSQKERDCSF